MTNTTRRHTTRPANGSGQAPGSTTFPEPADLDAERALVGSCVLDGSGGALGQALEKLRGPEDLYDPGLRHIFTAAQELARAAIPIDTVSIMDVLRREQLVDASGGLPNILKCTMSVPSAANATHYAAIVREKSQIRLVREAARKVLRESEAPGVQSSTLTQFAQAEFMGLNFTKNSTILTALEWTLRHHTRLQERASMKSLPYIEVGNKGVDDSGMLRRSGLVVIGGRPASGKSAWAMNLGVGAAQRGYHVLIVEIEMPEDMMADRFTAGEGSIDTRTLERSHLMSASEWMRANQALKNLSQLPLDMWVVDQLHINDLYSTVVQYDRIRKLDLVIVDYIQLMKGHLGDGREREISSISWGLKTLASTTNTCVVGLSQLSRKVEERTPPRPILSDLRESGSLEQDAMVVQFIYRPALYDGRPYESREEDVEALIAKFRGGAIGHFPLSFDKPFQTFTYNGPP